MVFYALIVGLMVTFVLRYRQRPGHGPQPSASHNTPLEMLWSVIPSILVAIIFLWGFFTFLDIRQAPANSYEIRVIAKKWVWSFAYPNGYVDADLHLPANRPVRLVMSSDDVIHSLYIPAFRTKMDIVPGRYSSMWFEATEPGEFPLFCAEYCGTKHAQMSATVKVHPSGEFERWLADASNFLDRMTPVDAGRLLYNRRGCFQCHSLDGTAKTGPTFKDSFGTQQALTDGSLVTVEENYIRQSILEPQAKVRAGFKPVMPTYQGQLNDREIDALIEFIKSLRAEPASV
jgi:cytochrome c oxidase subunit 2